MKLISKAITAYNNVNSFKYGNQWSIRSGEENTLYFQIVDLDQESIRYMVGIGLIFPVVPSIAVTFPSVDDALVITVAATQVDPTDASIWKVNLLSTQFPMSGNVMFAITEGSKIKRFSALSFISVENVNGPGECY